MMNQEVIVTCAVTGGAADSIHKHPAIPKTADEIATAAIEAANAGAAIVHIHVRDPETGEPSDETHLYGEVVHRIRASSTDVVINLTTGMGTDLVLEDQDPTKSPAVISPESDFTAPAFRFEQVERYRPEMCTLDVPAMSSGGGRYFLNPPAGVRYIAEQARAINVKPEIEIFDTGDIWIVRELIAEGLLADPPLFQLCTGIKGGMLSEPRVLQTMVDLLPEGSVWAAFGISRMQFPMLAQSILMGGHVRVGLEDNLYLSRGVHASNAQLVERAVAVTEALGARVLSPAEAREKLNLVKQDPIA
jgi:uncharacterized protein (DUF849 family)